MSVIVEAGAAPSGIDGIDAIDETADAASSRQPAQRRSDRRTSRARLRIVVEPVRPSRWAVSVMLTAAIAAFAAVGINVARVEGQRRLDRVHAELAAEQARTDALHRRESKIQSPAEVVRIATEELGLIPAAPPVAVAAPAQVVAPPATSPAPTGPTGAASTDQPPTTPTTPGT